jgi:hypothetical protein
LARKFNLYVGRPFGLGIEQPDVGDFMFELGVWAAKTPSVGDVVLYTAHSSRILMNRNMFAHDALKAGVDFLLMIDPDMRPDLYRDRPGMQRFMVSSWQHALENPGSVIGAPAVGGSPKYDTNVFIAGEEHARRMTHAEVLERQRNPCIEQVHAIGTGLILIDMLVFRRLAIPFFDDVYENPEKTKLAKSQDVVFTEACTKAGFPVWCNHYAWAGHHKDELLGCPGFDEPEKSEPAPGDKYPLPITLDPSMVEIN